MYPAPLEHSPASNLQLESVKAYFLGILLAIYTTARTTSDAVRQQNNLLRTVLKDHIEAHVPYRKLENHMVLIETGARAYHGLSELVIVCDELMAIIEGGEELDISVCVSRRYSGHTVRDLVGRDLVRGLVFILDACTSSFTKPGRADRSKQS